MKLHIALYEPEIPPNTGNIIRLCANTGASLHLIQPLGFSLEDKQLRRAGLDYHEFANLRTYKNYEEFIEVLDPERVFAFSTRGTLSYADVSYRERVVCHRLYLMVSRRINACVCRCARIAAA